MKPAPHLFTVRVYYEDTDFSGVVYHGSYLHFIERARTELLRSLGIHQGAILAGQSGEVFGFMVRSMTVDFLRPARMDDELTVETRPLVVGGASVDLAQRVLRGDEVLVDARVKVASVAGGRVARLPDWIRAKFAAAS